MLTKTKETHYSELGKYWLLEKDFVYLNHGAFGACPSPVLEKQQHYRDMLEHYPIRFMIKELGDLFNNSKQTLADFIGVKNSDLAFVTNATQGVNTVFKSLKFQPGDEILITNKIYPACRNVVNFICSYSGARVVEVGIDIPVNSEDEIIERIVSATTTKTRLALIDHVTFQTSVIIPVKKIIRALEEKGIDTIVDGAHAPGAIPIRVEDTGAAYYTGNCHKWLCAPKGAGFLYVRDDKQKDITPLSISHTAGPDSTFEEKFFWTGTYDPSPVICVGDSIRFMGSLFDGGWTELMTRNRQLALTARKLISEKAGLQLLCPDEFVGTLASFRLPDAKNPKAMLWYEVEELQGRLNNEFGIEVPVMYWPQMPHRLLRISAQVYNSLEQYEYLAEALNSLI